MGDGEAEAVGVGNGVADAVGSGATVGVAKSATTVASRALTLAARSDSTVASKSAVEVEVEVEPGITIGTDVGVLVTRATTVESVLGRGNGVATEDWPQATTTNITTSNPKLMTRPIQAAPIFCFTSAYQVD